MHNDNQGFEVCGGWSALTPALSPRRGRIIRRLTQGRVTENGSTTLEQIRAASGCSLSPGERVGVRAGVPSQLKFWNSESEFYN